MNKKIKLRFPTSFGESGLIGVSATEDIPA